jgi:molybdopterin molybdotransferase
VRPRIGGAGFFTLKTLDEARALCDGAFGALRVGKERVAATPREALGRVLSADVRSPGPVPHFARSTVDGFAVRSADTAGATGGQPVYLEVVGRVLMGKPAELALRPGEAAEVPTGGMLPAGANAAVMVEHTERLGDTTVEIGRAVAPGVNVIGVGDDVGAGALCLEAGRRLGAGDLALLAAIGVAEVEVFRRPVVALLATGDEVVPPTAVPGPAEVRDSNSAGLSALVRLAGGEPRFDGIVKDVARALADAARASLEGADVLLINGGSSVGDRDHAAAVIDGLGRPGLLFHGVAIKPGKPTIAALAGVKPVFGLPGHPVSAMVSFHCLVRPVIARLGGELELFEPVVTARLARAVPSDAGRTELVRVRLVALPRDQASPAGVGFVAEPLFGPSAALTSLVSARGLVEIPLGVEGLDAGEIVAVRLL